MLKAEKPFVYGKDKSACRREKRARRILAGPKQTAVEQEKACNIYEK
jgi:hypothetical protein